jgi:hypothetical protein
MKTRINGLATLVVIMLFAFSSSLFAQQPELQYFRKWDQEGINVFEPSKKAPQPEYTGFKIRVGGAFTQDFQSLTHSNSPNGNADNYLFGVITDPTDAKFDTTSATLQGFNLAMANLNFDFQIADGIRVGLENYMSSRHHPEFWVKGGYIQIDKLPMFDNTAWFDDYLRVKIGHFQPNFGDMQFRRTDGGNAMFNPFVENFIMDAFTTEIGGEVYLFPVDGFMVMLGMTSGFINGNINAYGDNNNASGVVPTKKTPSIFGKVAYDKQLNEDLRFRLSASVYNNSNIQRNTLYAGDRTGSHYFMMMERVGATTAGNFTSGRFNPSMANRITAFMINPFIKYQGLEIFGSYELISGSNYNDTKPGEAGADPTWERRNASQYSAEAVYRFLANEQLFAGLRYTGATAEMPGLNADGGYDEVSINRMAIAAGWFPTKNLLLKAEYVLQNYEDFKVTDYRNEGQFSGFMVQAVVGF